jgi:hypothetical protein
LPVIFESARISSNLITSDLGLAPREHGESKAPESEEHGSAEAVMMG